MQIVKGLRHPHMLHYQWDQQDGASIAIITSPVTPLSASIDSTSIQEIALGLHSILEFLVFMHSKVVVCDSPIL